MREITIPLSPNPYTCKVNGEEYTYPSGTVQLVPDDVAELIENNEAEKKKQEPYSPEKLEIVVDSQLSEESENPVQNKVITAEVGDMAETFSAYIEDIYQKLEGSARSVSEINMLSGIEANAAERETE